MSSLEEAREVLQIEAEALYAVRDQLGPEFNRAVDLIMRCPTRLVITGIGKSGIIGQKIVATLNSTGTPAFFLHPVEALHGDLGMVCLSDVVLAISYSGQTTELETLLDNLRVRGVSIIAMTGNSQSKLARNADVQLNISVPREACPLGLAPTSSTTATLALGDALAIALLNRKKFQPEDFRRNHPGGSLGERLKVAVRQVMLTGAAVPRVEYGSSLEEAINELNRKSLGAVLVAADHHLCGIITDGDIRRLVSRAEQLNNLQLDQVMTGQPVTIQSHLLAADALSIMQEKEITVLPVIEEDGHLSGILHLHDLLGKGEFRFLI